MTVAEKLRRNRKITMTTRQRSEQGKFHIVHRLLNGFGTVEKYPQLGRGGQLLWIVGKSARIACAHLDGIRTGLSLDGQDNRALGDLAVDEPGSRLVVLDAIDDPPSYRANGDRSCR
jgi:hypothetical protein